MAIVLFRRRCGNGGLRFPGISVGEHEFFLTCRAHFVMPAVIAVIAPVASRTRQSFAHTATIADEQLLFHQCHDIQMSDPYEIAIRKNPRRLSPAGVLSNYVVSPAPTLTLPAALSRCRTSAERWFKLLRQHLGRMLSAEEPITCGSFDSRPAAWRSISRHCSMTCYSACQRFGRWTSLTKLPPRLVLVDIS